MKVYIKHIMELTELTRRQVKEEITEIWPLMIVPGQPIYFDSADDIIHLLKNMKKRGKINLDKK